jgi:hypothetical protein
MRPLLVVRQLRIVLRISSSKISEPAEVFDVAEGVGVNTSDIRIHGLPWLAVAPIEDRGGGRYPGAG